MSANVTSGFSVICIIWIAASDSGGKMSTTAWECRCIAILADDLSFSLYRVESTLTK